MPKHSNGKIARSQYRFDFEREQRERRQLIEAVTNERAGLSRVRWNHCKGVLLFMVNCDQGQGIFPYIESIAAACNLGRRTVDRAIADLKELQIATAETRRNKQGRGSNQWLIHFDVLASLGSRSSVVNQRHSGIDRRHSVVNQRQNGVNPYKELAITHSSPIDSTTTSSSGSFDGILATLSEEEAEEKFVAGVFRALPHHTPLKLRDAIQTARKNGCEWDQLRERAAWFVQHWSGRWSSEHVAGAFYSGLINALSGMAADQGWPYKEGAKRRDRTDPRRGY